MRSPCHLPLETNTDKPHNSANVIPWGADTTILLPRFINIRRGMYISYILGLVICPWNILNSATSFLRFLGGYSIFLGPFVGIFLTDYLVVRNGNVRVPDLYDPAGVYWYRAGVSWRAVVAYLVAVVLPIPGFSASFGCSVSAGAVHLYEIGWLLTCVVSSVVYWALCRFCGAFALDERRLGFEALAGEQSEAIEGPYVQDIVGIQVSGVTKV